MSQPQYIITASNTVTPTSCAPLYYQGPNNGFSWYSWEAKAWKNKTTAEKHLSDVVISGLQDLRLINQIQVQEIDTQSQNSKSWR